MHLLLHSLCVSRHRLAGSSGSPKAVVSSPISTGKNALPNPLTEQPVEFTSSTTGELRLCFLLEFSWACDEESHGSLPCVPLHRTSPNMAAHFKFRRETACASKMEVMVFCNLLIRVMSHHFAIFYLLKSSNEVPSYPLGGNTEVGGIWEGRNYWEQCQNHMTSLRHDHNAWSPPGSPMG
jgi:hypothetical protein